MVEAIDSSQYTYAESPFLGDMNDRALVQRKARMKLLEEHKAEIETNKRNKILMKLESDRADSPQNNNFLDLIAQNLKRNNQLHADKRT